MPAQMTPGVKKLLSEANLAHLATLMKDGSPQVTPVWVDLDGERIVVNTAEGRAKPRNVRRDPRIAISIAGPTGYPSAFVRGRVVKVTNDGADAHIDKLAKKYLGEDKYPWAQPGDQRVILVIEPEHVTGMMTD